MQEQNFEEGVRSKMEELSFTPSAPVWLKVEEQIRKKKDRRRLLFFWLLPALLLGGGLIWQWADLSQNNATQNRTSNTRAEVTKSTPDKKTTLPESNLTSIKEKEKKKSISTRSINDQPVRLKTALAPATPIKAKGKATAKTKTQTSGPFQTTSTKYEVETFSNPALAVTTGTTSSTIATKPAADTLKQTINAQPIASIALKDSIKPSDTITSTPKSAIASSKKWRWSAYITAGRSGVRSGLFGEEKAMLNYNSPASSPSAPLSAASTSLRNGFSFSTGLGANRKVNERLDVTVGIQYHYFSTKMKVGAEMVRDTTITQGGIGNGVQTVSRYYLPGSNSNYTNRYHFIELPVGIEWRVAKRLPLYLTTGFSVSRLISTNTLATTGNGSIYYRSSDHLNKTQVHFFGGLNYHIWQSTKYALHLGPQVNYGLTPLQKNNVKGALSFTGIRAGLTF